MAKNYFIIFSLLYTITLESCSQGTKNNDQSISIKSKNDSTCYALGVTWAEMILNKTGMQTENYSLLKLVEGFNTELHTEAIFDSICLNKIKSFNSGKKTNDQVKNEASYCLGKFYAHGFIKKWGKAGVFTSTNLNLDIVSSGFSDVIMKKELKISKENRKNLFDDFYDQGISNLTIIMMDSIKLKKNVQKIENEIFIETIKDGNGKSPHDSSDVAVDYILSTPLKDTVENTFIRFEKKLPVPKFNIKEMYQGWSHAFPKLEKNGIYRVYMPFEMFRDQRLPFPYICFYVELLDFGNKGSMIKINNNKKQ